MDKNSTSGGDVSDSVLSIESIRAIADSVGVDLEDEAAKELADDVTQKLKLIIQDATRFMEQSRRTELTTQDIDHSLKMKNIEPLYGFQTESSTPFRFASGGSREMHFMEEEVVDLHHVLSAPMPKVPADVSIRPHWLAIEGTQPAIPENPPPQSLPFQQRKACIYPSIGSKAQWKPVKSEQVFVKQLATHELSVEQQFYYKEITEACVGWEEKKRVEALQSLANDPGLYVMLPRLCTFIAEGVRVNVVQCNLMILTHLMKMVRSLLDNETLAMEKYLHDIIPGVVTCIVSKYLCGKPEQNHWALRDFAAGIIADICKTYSTSINDLQTRITKVLCSALMNKTAPLTSLYGAIVGLSKLGPEVVKTFVLPKLNEIGDRLEFCIKGVGTSADQTSAVKIRNLILKEVTPIIKNYRSPTDSAEDCEAFGYLAGILKNSEERISDGRPRGLSNVSPLANKSISRPISGSPRVIAQPTTATSVTLGFQQMELVAAAQAAGTGPGCQPLQEPNFNLVMGSSSKQTNQAETFFF